MGYKRGDYRDKWRIERTAEAVRGRIGLDQLAVLDVSLLVDDLGAEVFHLRDLIQDDEVALRRARRIDFDGAVSLQPQTGQPVIIMNCGRPVRRRLATLMEELAHLLLKHKPSRIALDPDLGIVRRSYNREQENEAYDLGAALLLPRERIQRDVKELQLLVDEIADAHGCSEQLVTYRIRRMRLWTRYAGYATEAS
jgi:Zn-dependent peptidase ImmA (M78 family)